MKLPHIAMCRCVQAVVHNNMGRCLPPFYYSPHLPSPIFFFLQKHVKAWPPILTVSISEDMLTAQSDGCQERYEGQMWWCPLLACGGKTWLVHPLFLLWPPETAAQHWWAWVWPPRVHRRRSSLGNCKPAKPSQCSDVCWPLVGVHIVCVVAVKTARSIVRCFARSWWPYFCCWLFNSVAVSLVSR